MLTRRQNCILLGYMPKIWDGRINVTYVDLPPTTLQRKIQDKKRPSPGFLLDYYTDGRPV